MRERQEVYCHHCDSYISFIVDLEVSGRYVVNCPKCNHEHFRIVENGRVTANRWTNHPTIETDAKIYSPNDYTTCTSGPHVIYRWEREERLRISGGKW